MDITVLIKTVIYGIIEGITEWLPVSSTGHLILYEEFFFNLDKDFMEMFRVVIQLGAILAVVVLFFGKLWPWGKGKSLEKTKNIFNLRGKVIVACLPAAVIGLVADSWLDKHLYNKLTVAVTLILYGVGFIIVENLNKNGKLKLTQDNVYTFSTKTAFLIGMFQLLALVPGTSRSGATILGAMILGCSRTLAAEFSFFLAIPVMVGAGGLKSVKYALKIVGGEATLTSNEIAILAVGTVVAFVVSLIAIRFLMNFIKHHDFKFFAWYRIALGLIVFGFAIPGLIK